MVAGHVSLRTMVIVGAREGVSEKITVEVKPKRRKADRGNGK